MKYFNSVANSLEKIKAVFLDLDGTVYEPEREPKLTHRLADLIAQLEQLGVRVSIATGRSYPIVLDIAKQLGIVEAPMVTTQGAVVLYPDGSFERCECIVKDDQHRVLEFYREIPTSAVLFSYKADGELLTWINRWSEPPEFYQKLFVRGLKLNETPEVEPGTILKVVFVKMTSEWQQILSERLPDYPLTQTHEDLREITHPHISKGAGVETAAKAMGLELEEVMAIGDNYNDIPIFEKVGLPCAMGSAPEEVRALCPVVTEDIWNQGAELLLEELIAFKLG